VLTLMQTGRSRIIPLVLVAAPACGYWKTWFFFLFSLFSSANTCQAGLVFPRTTFNLFQNDRQRGRAIAGVVHFLKKPQLPTIAGREAHGFPDLHQKLTRAGCSREVEHRLRDLLVRGSHSNSRPPFPRKRNETLNRAALPRLILTWRRTVAIFGLFSAS